MASMYIYQDAEHILFFHTISRLRCIVWFSTRTWRDLKKIEEKLYIIIVITQHHKHKSIRSKSNLILNHHFKKKLLHFLSSSKTYCVDFISSLFLHSAITPILQVRQCPPMCMPCFKKTLCKIIILGKLARIWRSVPSWFMTMLWSSLLLLLV